MKSRINDLKEKEVINISDGVRLGYVTDVEVDLSDGKLVSIIVEGTYRLMGLFGKSEDIVIKWESIKKIGNDIIVVDSI